MYGKNVVIGVSGGIAAYKICEVVSGLKKLGANVDVIMTRNATEFVAPLTFETLSQNPVVTDMFARETPWEVEHVSLAKKADVFLIAPATANVIGKMANGIADDMLTTTVLATNAPVLVAPAMNTAMWQNQIVQQNAASLEKRGFKFIQPESGRLACGDNGAGRLAEPQTIIDAIVNRVMPKRDLAGKHVLVTAGGTMEKIDPVRCLTNFSSGKMGCEIARNALDRGACVTLVLGLHTAEAPKGASVVNVETTDEMHAAVLQNLKGADIVIKAAAPCDYAPKQASAQKIKGNTLTLELQKNPDIAEAVSKAKDGKTVLVIFAAETEDVSKHAKEKLKTKHADFVVANDVTQPGAGFGTDTNIALIIGKDGTETCTGKVTKYRLAEMLFDRILTSGQHT